MYTVIVTGITGKSGRHFLRRLLEEKKSLMNYSFKFICRTKDKGSKNSDGYTLVDKAVSDDEFDAEILNADLNNSSELQAAFSEKADMLIHIAGIEYTTDVVQIALGCGINNIITVHTTGIYSKYKEASKEYKATERKLSDLINNYRKTGREISLTILRPTMIYGDLNDKNISVFIKMVDKLRIFPLIKGGKYELQPVWCRDLGDAYYGVMSNWEITKNKEYILSGGKALSLCDMLSEIGRQLGVKNRFVYCPYSIACIGAYILLCLSFGKVDMREKVKRLAESRAYGYEEAKRDFGYSPVEFSQGVAEEIEMYKEKR